MMKKAKLASVAILAALIASASSAQSQTGSRNVIINKSASPAERAAIIRGAARRGGENAYRQQMQQENMRSRPANSGGLQSGTSVVPNR